MVIDEGLERPRKLDLAGTNSMRGYEAKYR